MILYQIKIGPDNSIRACHVIEDPYDCECGKIRKIAEEIIKKFEYRSKVPDYYVVGVCRIDPHVNCRDTDLESCNIEVSGKVFDLLICVSKTKPSRERFLEKIKPHYCAFVECTTRTSRVDKIISIFEKKLQNIRQCLIESTPMRLYVLLIKLDRGKACNKKSIEKKLIERVRQIFKNEKIIVCVMRG